MRQKNLLFIIYFAIASFLFVGNAEIRLAKANFFAKTIFYPFTIALEQLNLSTSISAENQKLRRKVAEQAILLTQLGNQMARIKQDKINFPLADSSYIMADIIGYSSDIDEQTLLINKGIIDNISLNDPVIAADGIVGKIINVFQNFSVVLPINHQDFKLPVLNQTSQVQGILETDSFGNTAMSYVKIGVMINVGDTIVTSNISHIFPRGYPVGTVSKLQESQDNLYQKAVINPFVKINRLEHVFILKH